MGRGGRFPSPVIQDGGGGGRGGSCAFAPPPILEGESRGRGSREASLFSNPLPWLWLKLLNRRQVSSAAHMPTRLWSIYEARPGAGQVEAEPPGPSAAGTGSVVSQPSSSLPQTCTHYAALRDSRWCRGSSTVCALGSRVTRDCARASVDNKVGQG